MTSFLFELDQFVVVNLVDSTVNTYPQILVFNSLKRFKSLSDNLASFLIPYRELKAVWKDIIFMIMRFDSTSDVQSFTIEILHYINSRPLLLIPAPWNC